MRSRYRPHPLRGSWLVLTLLLAGTAFFATPDFAFAQEAGAPQTEGRGRGEGRMPLFGKITAVHDSSIEIEDVNGGTTTVKLTDKTEFRKDRQPAKRTDFKVGDVIIVRGEENPDRSWTAQIIGARSMNGNGPNARGGGGPGRGGRGDFGQAGTLGKDFVAGEIKSVDAPKISVLRTDNVTQTIELNEDTSLRKGRDAVTMADIQVGDHLFARGGLENNVFVPKMVMVIGAEQWKRMQEMGGGPAGGQRRPPPGASGAGSDQQKPAEPQR
jgi:Domain of unknown function (DUF5666)